MDSLLPLREQLDTELILVDTGCSTEMRKKLMGYTDQIIPFVWCDDFAKARNAGLMHAKGEWFLFLDDDEWFEDVSPIIAFFQSGEYQEYEQAVYFVRNYAKRDGSDYSDDWVSRMIRLHEDTHFEGSVHESLVPTLGKCKRIAAFVHHYGYAFETEEARRRHYARNVSILERLMRQEPENIRWWLQIVPEYIGMHDGRSLVRAAEEALAKLAAVDTPFLNQCRGTFYSAVLTGLAMERQDGEALRLCRVYSGDVRNTCAGNASLYLLGMEAADRLRLLGEMADLGKQYFAALKEQERAELSEQEQIIAESILLVKDAFSDASCQTMRFLYGKALAELGRSKEYPGWLRGELRHDVARQLEHKGDFLMLPDSCWELGKAGILPLEEIFLALPMEQWMVQVCVLMQSGDRELIAALRGRLQTIRTRENVRYFYFDMHTLAALVKADGQSTAEDTELSRLYAEACVAYAKYIYTGLAFEGDMALLPEEIREAVRIMAKMDGENKTKMH